MQRLQALQIGADVKELLPQNQRYIEERRKRNEYSREWVKKNREKVRKRKREWNKNHPEIINKARIKWLKNNLEKVREKNRRYKATHKEEQKHYDQERRYKKALARLDEWLTVWVQIGKPWEGGVFQALEKANQRVAYYVAKKLEEEEGLVNDNETN